jgi:hypothetical protein
MIKLINILNEDAKDGVYIDTDQAQSQLGKSTIDPKSGIKSTLSAINPETGGMTWDIDYTVDPEHVYSELDKLVKYMDSAKDGELLKIKDILKKLKNQTHRMIK